MDKFESGSIKKRRGAEERWRKGGGVDGALEKIQRKINGKGRKKTKKSRGTRKRSLTGKERQGYTNEPGCKLTIASILSEIRN